MIDYVRTSATNPSESYKASLRAEHGVSLVLERGQTVTLTAGRIVLEDRRPIRTIAGKSYIHPTRRTS